MRVLITISLSELVPSKSMIVSSLRNVRAKSVLDTAAVGVNDGDVESTADAIGVLVETLPPPQ